MITDNLKGALWVLRGFAASRKINYQRKSALQATGNCGKFVSFLNCKSWCNRKRASLRLSVKIKASVSIEASIAIPIFLFCFLEIMSLLNYISVYSGILYAMKAVGDPTCVYGYAYDLVADEKEVSLGEKVVTAVLFSEVYLDNQVKKQCDSLLYENTVENGVEGISLLGSYVDRENSDLSIVARYTLKPLISFTGTKLPVICRYYGKMWTGYAVQQEVVDEEYVYITENGSVYHLTEACTHLKLSISRIDQEVLNGKYNESGRRYTACMLCCEDKVQAVYYITDSGRRYHAELSCSGLKRTVYRVELEEVEDWPVCSRCAKEGN